MATAAERNWLRAEGVTSICVAFNVELERNGKLEDRGHAQIDTFVANVNKRLTRTISAEDLAYAESWASEGDMMGTQGGYILAQLIKQVRALHEG